MNNVKSIPNYYKHSWSLNIFYYLKNNSKNICFRRGQIPSAFAWKLNSKHKTVVAINALQKPLLYLVILQI